jgi:recombinational DNA repair protein (RecF pathway)
MRVGHIPPLIPSPSIFRKEQNTILRLTQQGNDWGYLDRQFLLKLLENLDT